jgi:hypothetical protein
VKPEQEAGAAYPEACPAEARLGQPPSPPTRRSDRQRFFCSLSSSYPRRERNIRPPPLPIRAIIVSRF